MGACEKGIEPAVYVHGSSVKCTQGAGNTRLGWVLPAHSNGLTYCDVVKSGQ